MIALRQHWATPGTMRSSTQSTLALSSSLPGRMREAFAGAQQLLQRARAAGEQAYPGADYDLAMACFLLARVLRTAGGSEQALRLLDEAHQHIRGLRKAGTRTRCGTDGVRLLHGTKAPVFFDSGRLDKAAAAYEEFVHRAEKLTADRDVAVGKGQLATVRVEQRRYGEALAAYKEAQNGFRSWANRSPSP